MLEAFKRCAVSASSSSEVFMKEETSRETKLSDYPQQGEKQKNKTKQKSMESSDATTKAQGKRERECVCEKERERRD